MSASSNVAPVIIKKKKVIAGGGHHGGAWKVAYADFVTAMMAFFMLMWLLNATTEKQRKGIADYFSPTIPINRISGGGDGALGGDSIFTEMTLPKNGTGASMSRPTSSDKAAGSVGDSGKDKAEDDFKPVEDALMGRGAESMVAENALKHVITRVTDEGLVIEIFATDAEPIFNQRTSEPTDLLRQIAGLISGVSQAVTNSVAIDAHLPSEPVVIAQSQVWDLSSDRADVMRRLLQDTGLQAERINRIAGHADREHAVKDPMDVRNDRLEIIFLRE